MAGNRTRVRLSIAELTVEDGKVSGSIEMTVSENGETQTARHVIGEPIKPATARRRKSSRKEPTHD